MAGQDAGTVGIKIQPTINATEFAQQIKSRLDSTLDRTGTSLGRTLGSAISNGAKTGFSATRIVEAIRDSTPRWESQASIAGAKIGRQLARDAKDSFKAATRDMPGVRVDVEINEASLVRARKRLEGIGPIHVALNVDADTAAALAKLLALRAEADETVGRTKTVRVNADTSEAQGSLMVLGLQLAALSAIQIAPPIVAGLGGIAAAAGAAGLGVAGLAAVAVPGISNIKNALQAEKTASTSAATASQTHATALNTAAIAAAQAQLRVMAMAQAEQQVTTAQQAAKQAQLDLNKARVEGARALVDQRNQLIDAGLTLRGDQLAVERAKAALDALNNSRQDTLAIQQAQAALLAAQTGQRQITANPTSTDPQKAMAKLAVDQAAAALKAAQDKKKADDLARREAQLAYQQAVQQLKKQQLAYQRLQADERAAAKAGVEGTTQVVTAKQRLQAALKQVAAAQAAVRQQQIQDRIAQLQQADAARQAAAQADKVSASQTKLADTLAALSPAERKLMGDFQQFKKVYRDWVVALEPDVLPLLSGGMHILSAELGKMTPMVRASASAMKILEVRAAAALDGPFWSSFIANMSVAAPRAILGFGSIAGHTMTGLAGVFNAFLPYTTLILNAVDKLALRFQNWGTSLGGSTGFIKFMGNVQQMAPKLVADVESIAKALFEIGKALAPLGSSELALVKLFADGLAAIAHTYPQLIQVGAAIYMVAKAAKMLQITSLVSGFTATGTAATAASGGVAKAGSALRTFGASMMGVSAEVATTRTALLGLGKAAAILAAFEVATTAINHFTGANKDSRPAVDQLKASMMDLARTGQVGSPILKEFSNNFGDMYEQARNLTDPTTSHRIADFFSGLINGLIGAKGISGSAKENFAQLDQQLVQMAQSGNAVQAEAAFNKLSIALANNGVDIAKVNSLFPQYYALLRSGTGQSAIFTEQINRQNQALSASAHAFMSSEQEVIDFNNSLSSATGLLGQNGRAFWGNSSAAIANRGAVLQAARVLQGYSDDLVNNNQVTDGNLKRLRSQRDQLIDLATRFLGSRKAAAAYVDQLVKIPARKDTTVGVTAKGNFQMQGMGGLFKSLPGLADLLGGGRAGGGMVGGAGGPRADSVLTPVSTGEMVINAPAVARHFPLLAAINDAGNRGSVYRAKGYAGGGLIGTTRALPSTTIRDSDRNTSGFAGGGIPFPREVGNPSWKRSYRYAGSPPPSMNSATSASAKDIAGMIAYAGGQTALSALIVAAYLAGGNGSKAVQFAQMQLGKPYVWGATGPDSWDCSGLTQAAWRYAGVNIPRVTYDQINSGTPTSQAASVPGDLYFPHLGHVMMVTGMGGDRALIHAPHTGTVVQYANWRPGGVYRHIAGPAGSGGGGGGAPKVYAQSQLPEFGWGSSQWGPLNSLWERESGWRWDASNPTSGAYGIPQALPGSKMASSGADWRTNPKTQINWGLGYIHGRYGSPGVAWQHSQLTGWYADGTSSARKGWGVVGENGPELLRFNGGEQVLSHEEALRVAAGALNSPLELADAVTGGGGNTHLHAHFDGTTRAGVQHEVQTAFHVLQVQAATKQRVGRKR